MMIIKSFVLLLCFTAGSYAIYGGVNVPEGKYPYVVSLSSYVNREIHWCAGTIINERWILTAASCLDQFDDNTFHVTAGSNNLNGGRNYYRVKARHVHPSFDPEARERYNIGLIELDEDIQFSDKIKPVKLPESIFSDSPFKPVGNSVQVVGWGIFVNSRESNELKEQTLTVRDNDGQCELPFKNANFMDIIMQQSYLCTLERVVCKHDDGGPVVNKDGVQVGIVPYIPFNGLQGCTSSNRFTRVATFMPWIHETIAKNNGKN